jgi:hypothetical protein
MSLVLYFIFCNFIIHFSFSLYSSLVHWPSPPSTILSSSFFSHPAFPPPLFSLSLPTQAPQSYPWSYNKPSPADPQNKTSPPSTYPNTIKQNLQDDVSAALLPGRSCHPLGLQGLAITHCVVTQADVKYICDLLEPVVAFRRSSNTPRSQSERERDKERGERGDKEKGDDSTTSSSASRVGRPRGLRYLDLGFNRIGCANSAEILRAAARGDLECLNLAGNFSNRGHVFLAAVVDTLAAGGAAGNISGKSEGDDGSSDGGSDDGHNRSGGRSGMTSRGSKNPLDLLSLHLPKQVPLLYTSHLKHLVSNQHSVMQHC